MISEHEGVKSQLEPIACRVDCLFPYHVIGACVRSPPIFELADCLFNLSSERRLVSTQNQCNMSV
jgi:hypothetical protein